MKYEDIEVGKTYLEEGNERLVRYKEGTTKELITLNAVIGLLIHNENQYKHWTEKHGLPDVGLVVNKTGGSLIYRTGEKSGYGFNRGIYEKSDFWTLKSRPHDWRKATQEEEQNFIELLKKEAERKGLGEDAKIKECFYNPLDAINNKSYEPNFNVKIAWNKHGCIFTDGEWATPLKNDLSEQIEELKNKAKELNLKITVTIE